MIWHLIVNKLIRMLVSWEKKILIDFLPRNSSRWSNVHQAHILHLLVIFSTIYLLGIIVFAPTFFCLHLNFFVFLSSYYSSLLTIFSVFFLSLTHYLGCIHNKSNSSKIWFLIASCGETCIKQKKIHNLK